MVRARIVSTGSKKGMHCRIPVNLYQLRISDKGEPLYRTGIDDSIEVLAEVSSGSTPPNWMLYACEAINRGQFTTRDQARDFYFNQCPTRVSKQKLHELLTRP